MMLLATFNFEGREVPYEKLKKCFEAADDWAFYAPNCWIIRTNDGLGTWYEKLRKILHEEDSIFVVEFQYERHVGYLPSDIVDWIAKQAS